MAGNTSRRYPPELKERAVRMVGEVRGEHESDWAELAAEAGPPVEIQVRGQETPQPEVAVAAYLCAAAVAAQAAPKPCLLAVRLDPDAVHLEARSVANLSGCLPREALDRVGALGGTTAVRRGNNGWTVEVRLPCGS